MSDVQAKIVFFFFTPLMRTIHPFLQGPCPPPFAWRRESSQLFICLVNQWGLELLGYDLVGGRDPGGYYLVGEAGFDFVGYE